MHSLVKLHILSTCTISGCKSISRLQYEDFKHIPQKKNPAFVCSSLFNPSIVHKVHRTREMKFLGFFCHLRYVSLFLSLSSSFKKICFSVLNLTSSGVDHVLRTQPVVPSSYVSFTSIFVGKESEEEKACMLYLANARISTADCRVAEHFSLAEENMLPSSSDGFYKPGT